jgi:hypothetical protein
MAKTNWQDPKTSEMRSTHVAGLMEAVGKIEDSIGMESVFETNVPLTEVFISSDDRYRIFQAPEGKRNWTAEQAPVIKRNGVTISSGFEIDYGGGAIILNVNDTVENTYTADVKYTKTTEIDVSADINAHNTSGTAHDDIRESINDLDAEVDGHIANGVHQKVEVTSTDNATSTVNAPLKSAGGLAVAKDAYINNAALITVLDGLQFTKSSGIKEFCFPVKTVGANKRQVFVFQLTTGYGYLFHVTVGGGAYGTGTPNRVFSIKKDISFRLTYNNTINTVVEHTGLISGFDTGDVYIEPHPIDADKIILYIENKQSWSAWLATSIETHSMQATTAIVEHYIEDIPV